MSFYCMQLHTYNVFKVGMGSKIRYQNKGCTVMTFYLDVFRTFLFNFAYARLLCREIENSQVTVLSKNAWLNILAHTTVLNYIDLLFIIISERIAVG